MAMVWQHLVLLIHMLFDPLHTGQVLVLVPLSLYQVVLDHLVVPLVIICLVAMVLVLVGVESLTFMVALLCMVAFHLQVHFMDHLPTIDLRLWHCHHHHNQLPVLVQATIILAALMMVLVLVSTVGVMLEEFQLVAMKRVPMVMAMVMLEVIIIIMVKGIIMEEHSGTKEAVHLQHQLLIANMEIINKMVAVVNNHPFTAVITSNNNQHRIITNKEQDGTRDQVAVYHQ